MHDLGYPARFRGVKSIESYDEYLGCGRRFYEPETFPALQCLWPDKSTRFPDEPNAPDSLRAAQPLLP